MVTDTVDGRIDVGHVRDIPPGGDLLVRVLDTEVGVYNLDGEFYAVRNYCPHRGGPICRGVRTGTMMPSDEVGRLEWGLEGRVLRCPWHRWEFDIVTGHTLFGIDKRRLIRYEVSVENERIYIHLRPEELRRLNGSGDEAKGDGNGHDG